MKNTLIYLFTFLVSATFTQASVAEPNLDLAVARTVAQQKIKEVFGAGSIAREIGFFFQDGASATDTPVVFDLGRVFYVAELKPEFTPRPTVWAAYMMGLNGEDQVVLVEDVADFLRIFTGGGIALLKSGSDQAKVAGLIAGLKERFPEMEISHLDSLGMITFSDPKNIAPAVIFLKRSPLVQSVELEGEVYRVPFAFELHRLTQCEGLLNAGDAGLRTVWSRLIEQFQSTGQKFSTKPSLPVSVGGAGPVPN